MTARRKDSGDLEVVNLGLSTQTFRLFLLVAVITNHQGLLNILGIGHLFRPDVAAVSKVEAKLDQLNSNVSVLHRDMSETKSKVENLSTRLSGFEIDFAKYRNEK